MSDAVLLAVVLFILVVLIFWTAHLMVSAAKRGKPYEDK